MRKQQEDTAMDAHCAGVIGAAVIHLPNFYGPRAALPGKRADWLGSAGSLE